MTKKYIVNENYSNETEYNTLWDLWHGKDHFTTGMTGNDKSEMMILSGLSFDNPIETMMNDREDLPDDLQQFLQSTPASAIGGRPFDVESKVTEGQGGTYGRSDFMLNPQHEDITTCVVCGRDIDSHSNPNTDYRGMRGDAPATDHYFLGGDQGGSDDKYDFESYSKATEAKWECLDCDQEFDDAGKHQEETGHHNIAKKAEEGGPGSGPTGKPALLPEQTARAQITPNYDPFRATPQSQRLQTDPELSRMTEEAPDDIDEEIFGTEQNDIYTCPACGEEMKVDEFEEHVDSVHKGDSMLDPHANEGGQGSGPTGKPTSLPPEPWGDSPEDKDNWGGRYSKKDDDEWRERQGYEGITNILNEADFQEDEHPRADDGKFSSGGGGSSGGDSEGKHSDKSEKDLVKAIKGGSKDWNDWGRNEKTEELYAEIEKRNKDIPIPSGKYPKVFRDDPDAVSKMEQKIKVIEDQQDYWKKIIKFPSRDYKNHSQLGDAKWYEMSLTNTKLRDAKKKLEGIKAQQERGTTLTRKPTYQGGRKNFYYSEEPKGEAKEDYYDKKYPVVTPVEDIVQFVLQNPEGVSNQEIQNKFYPFDATKPDHAEIEIERALNGDSRVRYDHSYENSGWIPAGESHAKEFKPELQGKKIKITGGDHAGEIAVVTSVEIFGDSVQVDLEGNRYYNIPEGQYEVLGEARAKEAFTAYDDYFENVDSDGWSWDCKICGKSMVRGGSYSLNHLEVNHNVDISQFESHESYAKEVVPNAKDYWEEEGWKEAEWQWGLKGYSTNWNELSKEQQDNVTNKFNAMVDEDPTIFEAVQPKEDKYSLTDEADLGHSGVAIGQEDWGEQSQKCKTCGKVFDVADNERIINHVREHKEKLGYNYEPDFVIGESYATESSVNCTKCQTRIWDKDVGYMNGTKEVKNDNGTVSVICGNCKNEVVSDGMGNIISGEARAKEFWEDNHPDIDRNQVIDDAKVFALQWIRDNATPTETSSGHMEGGNWVQDKVMSVSNYALLDAMHKPEFYGIGDNALNVLHAEHKIRSLSSDEVMGGGGVMIVESYSKEVQDTFGWKTWEDEKTGKEYTYTCPNCGQEDGGKTCGYCGNDLEKIKGEARAKETVHGDTDNEGRFYWEPTGEWLEAWEWDWNNLFNDAPPGNRLGETANEMTPEAFKKFKEKQQRSDYDSMSDKELEDEDEIFKQMSGEKEDWKPHRDVDYGRNKPVKLEDEESVDDPEDIDILDRLLENEEEEQEKGHDEEEDIALIAQLLDPEADESHAKERGTDYTRTVDMWGTLGQQQREDIIEMAGIETGELKVEFNEDVIQKYDLRDRMADTEHWTDTEERYYADQYYAYRISEMARGGFYEIEGALHNSITKRLGQIGESKKKAIEDNLWHSQGKQLNCPVCGIDFNSGPDMGDHLIVEHQWEESDFEQFEEGRVQEVETKVSPNSLLRDTDPLALPTGKNALDQTYGTSEPETEDGQDLTGKTLRRKGN